MAYSGRVNKISLLVWVGVCMFFVVAERGGGCGTSMLFCLMGVLAESMLYCVQIQCFDDGRGADVDLCGTTAGLCNGFILSR